MGSSPGSGPYSIPKSPSGANMHRSHPSASYYLPSFIMYRTLANFKLYIPLSLYNALDELFNVIYRS